MKFMLMFILALGLLLRLVNINQSFWLDEASQAQLSSLSLSQIWSGRSADFHPPLFYILAHYWMQLGKSESWLRLLPVAFGVFNIYALYLLTNRLFATHQGEPLQNYKIENSFKIGNFKLKIEEIAAFLLAINPFHIYYSQEFRSYSLLALLGTLSMYSYYKKHWSLFLFNALLLYTHYSSIFLITAQFIFTLINDKKYLKIFIFHFLLSTFLYTPWLPQFLSQLNSGVNIDTYLPGWRQILTTPAFKSLPLVIFKFTAGRINLLPEFVYGLYIMFVLTTAFLAAILARNNRRLLFTWLLAPIILSVTISLVVPLTQPFRLIFVLPALIILFSQACLRFPRLFITIFVYIAIVGNMLYFTRPRLQREQWRQAISFVGSQSHPASAILVKFSDKFSPFYWYNPRLNVTSAVSGYPARPEDVSARLSPLQNSSDIYLFEYLTDLTDPGREVEKVLGQLGYYNSNTYNFEGVGFIHKFTKQ